MLRSLQDPSLVRLSILGIGNRFFETYSHRATWPHFPSNECVFIIPRWIFCLWILTTQNNAGTGVPQELTQLD